MGDEHLSTFPEKEMDEFIKSSVEEIVPIPSGVRDTFVQRQRIDDESFLKEDVQEENFQVYSNPLFEFDDNYNSSDINPLFNEILEDVESEDSNVSILRTHFTNTPLSSRG
ncbi:hypothetical protein Tco_0535606 [Tanacetum coccineum]